MRGPMVGLRWSIVVLFATVGVIPGTATAGSPSTPELVDVPGDWSPEVPDSVATRGPEADLIKAYVHATNEKLIIVLQVARFSMGDGQYDVGWSQVLPYDSRAEWEGVRATVQDSMVTYTVTRGSASLPIGTWSPQGYAVTGQTQTGSPGTIVWEIARADGLWIFGPDSVRDGVQFYGFRAHAQVTSIPSVPVAGDPAGVRLEDSASSSSYFRPPTRNLRPLGPFDAPTRPSDFQDPQDKEGAPWDLREVWIDVGEDAVNVTVALSDFTPEKIEQCGLGIEFGVGVSEGRSAPKFVKEVDVPSLGGSYVVERNGTQLGWATRYATSGTLYANPSTPGQVRLSYPRSEWTGSSDRDAIRIEAGAQCRPLLTSPLWSQRSTGALGDGISGWGLQPQESPTLSPGLVVGALGAVCVDWRRRRVA